MRTELTTRQKEIAELVAKGLTNREIAKRLDVEEKTIKFHLTNVFKILGIKSRAHLIVSKLLEESVSREELSEFRKLL